MSQNFACSSFSVPKDEQDVKPTTSISICYPTFRLFSSIQSAAHTELRWEHRFRMDQSNVNSPSAPTTESVIPEDLALEIRKLAHDLSNALEIIVQTGYLLSTAGLKSPASDWLHMLDNGTSKALEINLALRSYIKTHSPK